jgi:hypothetical protein
MKVTHFSRHFSMLSQARHIPYAVSSVTERIPGENHLFLI